MVADDPTPSVERWLPVADCEGYDASDRGRVRSWWKRGWQRGLMPEPRIMSPGLAGAGYAMVTLCPPGKPRRHAYVHHLVLEAFVGPCPLDMECRHLDGNPANNRPDNLAWGTKQENTADKVVHGTMIPWREPVREPILFTDAFVPWAAVAPFEVWEDVGRFPGYQVSSWGRIASLWARGGSQHQGWHMSSGRTIMCLVRKKNGYLAANVRDLSGKRWTLVVHRAVIEAFNPQTDPDHHCLHRDGDRLNNRISNLRWGSHTENVRDRALHGTDNRGERHPLSKITTEIASAVLALKGTKPPKDVAAEFGLKPHHVWKIWNGRLWRHLTE